MHRRPSYRSISLTTLARQPLPAKVRLFEKGCTQTQFAKHAGYSLAWVNVVLNGRVKTPQSFRRALSEFLDVPEQELFPNQGGGP